MNTADIERLAKVHYTEYALRQERTMPAWQYLPASEREIAVWAIRAVLVAIEEPTEEYDYRTDPVNQPENIR